MTGSYDTTAKVWERQEKEGQQEWVCIATLEEHLGYVTFVSFSPDGRQIVTGSSDQTANVWKGVGAVKVVEVPVMTGEVVVPPASQPEPTKNIETLMASIKALLESIEPTNQPTSLKPQPPATKQVYSYKNYEHEQMLVGHEKPVTSVSLSPDGREIVTGSNDNTAKVCVS